MSAAITQTVPDQVIAIVAAHFDRRPDELVRSTRFYDRGFGADVSHGGESSQQPNQHR